jgi:hypothetical protein
VQKKSRPGSKNGIIMEWHLRPVDTIDYISRIGTVDFTLICLLVCVIENPNASEIGIAKNLV